MLEFEKNLGFIILLPEFRLTGLRTTVSTIKSSFDDSKCICVVPGDSNNDDLKAIKTVCPIVSGKTTISSMINAGIKKSEKPWNLVIMSGNIIRHNPIMKYKRFLESSRDIMYRVTDKSHWRWEDASIHGLLIHKDAMKEIGTFSEDEESFQLCKLIWGARAVEKNYKFKGLVGVRLF